MILGNNGAGKTSLLEAVYLLATTRSFRTAKLADCVQHDQQTFYLRGEIEAERRLSLEAAWIEGRRSCQINGEHVGLVEHLKALPVVAWSSAEEEVISGAPALRRRFMDRGIVSSRPAALEALKNFRRALEQKRHLLAVGGEGLEVWNEVLAAAIYELGCLRQKWVIKLSQAIQETLGSVSFSIPEIRVSFRPSISDLTQGAPGVLAEINRWSDREKARRRPLVGSQRDDLEILWGEREARRVASSGERKLVGLVLTAARARLLTAEGRSPVCLLDDADVELDKERLEATKKLFSECKQVLISSSRVEPWETWNEVKRWRLKEGRIAPLVENRERPRNNL